LFVVSIFVPHTRTELSVLQAVSVTQQSAASGLMLQYITVVRGQTQTYDQLEMGQYQMAVNFEFQRTPVHLQIVVTPALQLITYLGQLLAYYSGTITAAGLLLWLMETVVSATAKYRTAKDDVLQPLLSS
jgi:hypothetical protein